MPSQLTSVRLDDTQVEGLRMVADILQSNMAQVMRDAINKYLKEVLSSDEFQDELARSHERRRDLVESYKAHVR